MIYNVVLFIGTFSDNRVMTIKKVARILGVKLAPSNQTSAYAPGSM